MKIGGAPLDEDLRRIEAVLAALPAGCRLAVDANGRLGLRDSLAYADALAAYDLVWFEEPCDPLDFATLAAVADAYPGVLATGENLFSVGEVTNLLRYSGLRPGRDVLQMDPALSYGLTGYLASLAEMDRFGWSPARCCPHGGHQFNLHLAVALGLGGVESYPGIFKPFGGFADGVPVEAGHIRPPEEPGIGLEAKAGVRPLLASLVE
jgi:D(-)-tartrate dehydratase